MSEIFTFVVNDTSILQEVKEAMIHSGIEYEMIENRWCGPYGDEKSRALCSVKVENLEAGKTLARSIGCYYAGYDNSYYAEGKAKVINDHKNSIDHGVSYSKRPGPAKTRLRGMKGRYF